MANKKQTDTTIITENDKRYNRFTEEVKLANEYLRHIATLATGSIVILATFSQNFKILVRQELLYSIICLVVSLLAVVASESLLLYAVSRANDDPAWIPTKWRKLLFGIPIYIAYFTFANGILLLGITIIKNLL